MVILEQTSGIISVFSAAWFDSGHLHTSGFFDNQEIWTLLYELSFLAARCSVSGSPEDCSLLLLGDDFPNMLRIKSFGSSVDSRSCVCPQS